MKKDTKQEWTALCRTCQWCGRRYSDRGGAQQEVENHLKTHPQHKVRVLVTGEDKSADPVSEQNSVQEVWDMISKRQK